jgi:hypothetical protein
MDRRHACRAILLASVAGLLSCSSATPSLSPRGGSASVPPTGSPSSTAFPTVPTPSGSTSATASPSSPVASVLTLDLHRLPKKWAIATGPTVASDGIEIAWPAVAGRTEDGGPVVPDIVSFRPASGAEPAVVYRHPDRDSLIWALAVRQGHYAFLEMNTRLLGDSGWRLWALEGAGRKGVLLDAQDGPDDGRPAAAFGLSDSGVVWTAVHDCDGVPTFELRTAAFDGSGERVLLATPVAERQYWYPSIDASGTTLAYATVEQAGGADRFGLWTLDLAQPDARPVAVAGVEDATEPVLNGHVIAWRTVDDNVVNWGRGLMVVADAGAPQAIAPGELTALGHLTLGDRFVGFETISHQAVQLYDTVEHRLVTVEKHEVPDTVGIQPGWTLVAGDLLVFRRSDYADDADLAQQPEVVWAMLPPMP